jgi:hypothetical protein
MARQTLLVWAVSEAAFGPMRRNWQAEPTCRCGRVLVWLLAV